MCSFMLLLPVLHSPRINCRGSVLRYIVTVYIVVTPQPMVTRVFLASPVFHEYHMSLCHAPAGVLGSTPGSSW